MPRTLSSTAHAAVIDATVGLLADCSIREVTVDAVAARSGVAKTTIYRHFDSRDRLLAAGMRATLSAWPAPESTGDLGTDLRSWVTRFVDTDGRRRAPRAAIEFFAEIASSPVLAEVHDEMVDGIVGSLSVILEAARTRGELRPEVDLDLCVDAIAGPLIVRRLRGAAVDEDQAMALFRLVLEGIRSNG